MGRLTPRRASRGASGVTPPERPGRGVRGVVSSPAMDPITNAELDALERDYKRAERASVDSPDDATLRDEAKRLRIVYENRRDTARRRGG